MCINTIALWGHYVKWNKSVIEKYYVIPLIWGIYNSNIRKTKLWDAGHQELEERGYGSC